MGHYVGYFTYRCLSLRLILIEVSCRSFVCAVLCALLISGSIIIRTKKRIINRSLRKESIEHLDSGMGVPSLPPYTYKVGNRDSSVGIGTGLRTGHPRSRASIPGKDDRDFPVKRLPLLVWVPGLLTPNVNRSGRAADL